MVVVQCVTLCEVNLGLEVMEVINIAQGGFSGVKDNCTEPRLRRAAKTRWIRSGLGALTLILIHTFYWVHHSAQPN